MDIDIYLITHATSRWNELRQTQGHCDSELSDAGQRMALLLAERHDLSGVKAIYTSDLKRSYQTAEPLAAKHAIAFEKTPRLREGNWAHYHRDPAYPPLPFEAPFEDPGDLTRRAVQCMNGIAQSEHRSPILIVSHGAFVRCFLAETFPSQINEYKGIRTAINHVRYRAGTWRIVALNDEAHLRTFSEGNTALDSG